jgi:hypothetical protein
MDFAKSLYYTEIEAFRAMFPNVKRNRKKNTSERDIAKRNR